jgi:hypothetical protein
MNLVRLKGQRVKTSSQNTYASALHRFVKFVKEVLRIPIQDALPPGHDASIPGMTVQLFIGWAATRYKVSTILVTMNALADWQKSKELPTSTVFCSATRQLLTSVAAQQGPEGLPKGKEGLSKAFLRLLLQYLKVLTAKMPQQADLFTRDACWLVLGFYGMFRRSELIYFVMKDVQFKLQPQPHIILTVRFSKTDRNGAGAQVVLAHTTKDSFCIWEHIKRWHDFRLSQGAGPDDPLLTTWTHSPYLQNLYGMANPWPYV